MIRYVNAYFSHPQKINGVIREISVQSVHFGDLRLLRNVLVFVRKSDLSSFHL